MSLRASQVEVAVIGAGAAGIGAAEALRKAGVDVLLIEARSRLGGRAHTVQAEGFAIDLGCGWLHSADRNPWVDIAASLGIPIDRTLPPWRRPSGELGLTPADLAAFGAADAAYWDALLAGAERAEKDPSADRPAADFLAPQEHWNVLIDAISTYVNGAELERVSALDTCRYRDTEIDWRLPDGYGRLIERHGSDLPVALDTSVRCIDRHGAMLAIETNQGTLRAQAVVVAVPSNSLADGDLRFSPDLPAKRDAAAGVPLGHAEKVYFALDKAEEVEENGRFFGALDRTGTGAYHTKPFGRPLIEGYFGGRQAREMAIAGAAAMEDFAASEIAGVMGNDIRKRLRLLTVSGWAADPLARGSYSHALPGHAHARAILAAPVEDRIFFAGEAVSAVDFSTAHGAVETGWAAAKAYLATRPRGITAKALAG